MYGLLRQLQRFRRDEAGNFGMMLAILILPLGLAAGLAVDLSRLTTSKSGSQDALDAAAWAAAVMPDDTTVSDRQKKMQAVYSVNGGLGVVSQPVVTVEGKVLTLRASATGSLPTSLMKLGNVDTINVGVKTAVQAPMKIDIARFKVTKASGSWSKIMTLYGRVDAKSEYKPLMEINYPGGQAPTSSALIYEINPRTGAKTRSATGEINVGDMDSLLMRMQITASQSQIKQDYLWDIVQKLGLTAVVNNVTLTMPMVIDSNDPAAVQRMYITRTSGSTATTTQNDTTDIYERIRCGLAEEHSWEDGGSLPRKEVVKEKQYAMVEYPSSGTVSAATMAQRKKDADFAYEVTGRCVVGGDGGARLTE